MLMRRLWILAALLVPAASAQVAPDLRLAGVDSLAREARRVHALPSLVVGISTAGRRTVRGYGDVGGVTPGVHTPYEIGSVTKVVTALALADAVVRGEVALEAPVQGLLPDSVRLAVVGRPATLADLATHHAGLPRLPVPFLPASILDPYADYTPGALMRFVGAVVPDSAGVRYAYSNVGVGLLAWLLARRDGPTSGGGVGVEALLRRRVLGPLGMDETGVADPPGLAPPQTAAGDSIRAWRWTDALAGAGALRSTAADLLTLGEAVARPEERAPALADAIRLSLAPRAASAGRFRVGLVWHLLPAEEGPVRIAFHNGATFGSSAFLGIAPERDVTVVVLANQGAPGVLDALARDLLRVVLGE